MYEGKALSVTVGDDGIAELNLDLKAESVNKFNALTLGELGQAVEALAAAEGVKGLMVTSAKKVFVVGADITEFGAWFAMSNDELITDLMKIHDTFSALEDLPFPTVAVINGFALGGGFEVTLACDFRVMSTRARVGLPEVKLGIFPGWGGTIRLPRLIGLDNAIEWIGTGSDQQPADALKAGAVDAVVEPEKLQAAARSILQQCLEGKLDYQERRAEKKSPIRLNDIERAMVFTTSKAYVASKAGPHYPAPMIALEAMEKHVVLERDAAARIECEAFAAAANTPTATSLVGLFLNDQVLKKTAKDHAASAGDVQSAAVLGAGIMGGGIAFQAALRDIPMVMKDINNQAIALGLGEAKKLLGKRVSRGRMTVDEMADVLNRINPTLSYADVAPVDIVVEAVVENEKIKKSVLAELEGVVGENTVIASNTSTISIDSLATALSKPERLCGMHFFNPVHVMPLVEVIRGEKTSEQTVATTVSFAAKMGKSPIVVNNCPGFLVNRILFPYFNGFEMLLRDGADFRQVDTVMERFGWPMGPAYLLDVVGIDTAHHAASVLAEGYPQRMRLDFDSATKLLYEAGRLGQKSGSGFYKYEPDRKGKPRQSPDEAVTPFIDQVATGSRRFEAQEIVERMMVPLCLETVRCLEDNIVDSPVAADMGLIWGIGFPPHLGGALRYVDATGVAEFCRIADQYAELGEAYRPTDGLRDMAAANKRFFG